MSQRIVQVDAFTEEPFAGNPAAVCVISSPADEGWMQKVAREMNLSETAFLYPEGDLYHLRWFTPTTEVKLCGHATLASAHVLWEDGHLPSDRIARFTTKSGELTAVRRGEWIELDFPSLPPTEVSPPPGLVEAVSASPKLVAEVSSTYLLELDSADAVRATKPNFSALAKQSQTGVIVSALDSGGEFDFVSRFFAPSLGIDEDPVTGYAHCVLTPYWAGRLGKTEFLAYQASERGGVLRLRLEGDRVKLAGKAVTVMRGELV